VLLQNIFLHVFIVELFLSDTIYRYKVDRESVFFIDSVCQLTVLHARENITSETEFNVLAFEVVNRVKLARDNVADLFICLLLRMHGIVN